MKTRAIYIDYTNHRGERSWRRIEPVELRFESSQWHSTEQWVLYALDLDRGEYRSFTLLDIHGFRNSPDEA